MAGIGRIPFTSLDRFAQRYGVESLDAFDRFRTIIRLMDEAYRETAAVKADGSGKPAVNDRSGLKAMLQRMGKKRKPKAATLGKRTDS